MTLSQSTNHNPQPTVNFFASSNPFRDSRCVSFPLKGQILLVFEYELAFNMNEMELSLCSVRNKFQVYLYVVYVYYTPSIVTKSRQYIKKEFDSNRNKKRVLFTFTSEIPQLMTIYLTDITICREMTLLSMTSL